MELIARMCGILTKFLPDSKVIWKPLKNQNMHRKILQVVNCLGKSQQVIRTELKGLNDLVIKKAFKKCIVWNLDLMHNFPWKLLEKTREMIKKFLFLTKYRLLSNVFPVLHYRISWKVSPLDSKPTKFTKVNWSKPAEN